MRLFISWSGPRSRSFAMILRDWLPEVIQQVTPWVSAEDIAKGKRWSGEIAKQLGETSHGLLCVTRDNLREPWLNFEAGALAKSIEDARVTPLLLDLLPRDLVGPLAEFQAASALEREDVRRLLESLNQVCAPPLPPDLLTRSFGRAWDDYERQVRALLSEPDSGPGSREAISPPRAVEDMVGEVLDRVRSLERRFQAGSWEPSLSVASEARNASVSFRRALSPGVRQSLAQALDAVIAEGAPAREIDISQSGTARVVFSEPPDNMRDIAENLVTAFTSSPLRLVDMLDANGERLGTVDLSDGSWTIRQRGRAEE